MKIKTCFLKFIKLILYRGSLTIFLFGVFLYTPLFSQLPTAQQVAGQMKVGWNMGNTLEAICGETVWGGAYMGLFNRSSGAILDQGLLDAIMDSSNFPISKVQGLFDIMINEREK
ncbi:hypothetical protein JW935_12605 [candidate division KSB1 bacterium]|nr:hypothetical protein [candidate division KSB1 bacterium]